MKQQVRSWSRAPIKISCSIIRRHVPGLAEVVVPFDDGRSKIIADLKTALGLGLYRYGYQDLDVDLIRYLLRDGDTFIDGGAHVGLFTLVAASRIGPRGKVLAFEPGSWARARLQRNIALNGFHWVEVHPTALSDDTAIVKFVGYAGDAAALSSIAPAPSLPGGRPENIATIPLDKLITGSDRDRITLVKLDIEGSEVRALQGAREIMQHSAPHLLLEVAPENLARQGSTVGELLTMCSEAGYRPLVPERLSNGQLALRRTDAEGSKFPRPNVLFTRREDLLRQLGLLVVS